MPRTGAVKRWPGKTSRTSLIPNERVVVAYMELCKLRIAFLSAFSAATGYILGTAALESECFILAMGVLFLAAGAAALNQYQERAFDKLMPRTRLRPLPTKRVKPEHALVFSLILACSGLLILLSLGQVLVLTSGVFALAWYNGVYTHLKRVTAFAVVPGALTGMVPPFMGWAAAGGDPLHPEIMALCFFFFVWQVAHSWLLVLNYGDEYERAGLPCLKRLFATNQLLRITVVWMWAGAVACVILPFYGTFSRFLNYALLMTGVWLSKGGLVLLREQAGRFDLAFKKVNLFAVAVLVLICIERLLFVS